MERLDSNEQRQQVGTGSSRYATPAPSGAPVRGRHARSLIFPASLLVHLQVHQALFRSRNDFDTCTMGYFQAAMVKMGMAQAGPKITAQDRAILE